MTYDGGHFSRRYLSFEVTLKGIAGLLGDGQLLYAVFAAATACGLLLACACVSDVPRIGARGRSTAEVAAAERAQAAEAEMEAAETDAEVEGAEDAEDAEGVEQRASESDPTARPSPPRKQQGGAPSGAPSAPSAAAGLLGVLRLLVLPKALLGLVQRATYHFCHSSVCGDTALVWQVLPNFRLRDRLPNMAGAAQPTLRLRGQFRGDGGAGARCRHRPARLGRRAPNSLSEPTAEFTSGLATTFLIWQVGPAAACLAGAAAVLGAPLSLLSTCCGRGRAVVAVGGGPCCYAAAAALVMCVTTA